MRFETGNYYFFILSIAVMLLIIGYYLLRRHRLILRLFNNKTIENRLNPEFSKFKFYFKICLIILTLFFLVIAIFRPQYGFQYQTIKNTGIDIVFAIDLSNSMLANDIKPNRLANAKLEIKRCIDKYIKTDRVGIVAFAGAAFTNCPLTVDYEAVKTVIDALDATTITPQGTNIAAALERALLTLKPETPTNKVIILLTDGEDHSGVVTEKLEKIKEYNNIKVYTIGIGTAEGAPIMIAPGEFVKDNSGNIITSKLDEELLKNIALSTNGVYYRLAPNNNDRELSMIFEQIMSIEKKELNDSQLAVYEEKFRIFAIIAFILLVIDTILGYKKNNFKRKIA